MPDITLGELKEYIGIPAADTTRDRRVTTLANTANAYVRRRTGRAWGVETLTETYQGTGTRSLTLRRYPVTNLVSVTIGSWSVELTDDTIISCDKRQGILYRTDGLHWESGFYGEVPSRYDRRFPDTHRYLISVVYAAGLDVPDDLHGVTLEIAQFLWNASGGITGESGGGVRTSLSDKDLSKIPTVRDILESYEDPAKGYTT